MKILLITKAVNLKFEYDENSNIPPIKGVSPIRYYLHKIHPDWEVEILETRDLSIENTVAYIDEYSPDAVGLSLYAWNSGWFKTLIPKIKFPVFIGGPAACSYIDTDLPENVIFACIGEGEEVTLRGLEDYFFKGKIQDRQGLLTRSQKITIPAIFYDFIKDENSYIESELGDYAGKEMISWELSRGCPFNCSFCMWSWADAKRKVRTVSFERFKQEFDIIFNRKKIKSVMILDATFDYDTKRAEQILEYISNNAPKNAYFSFQMRGEMITENIAKYLSTIFHQVDIGLQSCDPEVLRRIYRPTNLDRFWEGINYLNKYNIVYNVDLIYMLPGQTNESFFNDINTTLMHGVRALNLNHLHLYPGVKLWEEKDTFVKSVRKDTVAGELNFVEETVDISWNDFVFMDKITKGLVLLTGNSREMKKLNQDKFFDKPADWRDIIDRSNSIQRLCSKLNITPIDLVKKSIKLS